MCQLKYFIYVDFYRRHCHLSMSFSDLSLKIKDVKLFWHRWNYETTDIIRMFDQGSSRTASVPALNLEPVSPVSTDTEPDLGQENRFQGGTRCLLDQKEQTAYVWGSWHSGTQRRNDVVLWPALTNWLWTSTRFQRVEKRCGCSCLSGVLMAILQIEMYKPYPEQWTGGRGVIPPLTCLDRKPTKNKSLCLKSGEPPSSTTAHQLTTKVFLFAGHNHSDWLA